VRPCRRASPVAAVHVGWEARSRGDHGGALLQDRPCHCPSQVLPRLDDQGWRGDAVDLGILRHVFADCGNDEARERHLPKKRSLAKPSHVVG